MKKVNKKGGHRLIVDQFQKIRKDHVIHKEKSAHEPYSHHTRPLPEKIECVWEYPKSEEVQCLYCSESIPETVIDSHKKLCQMKMEEQKEKQEAHLGTSQPAKKHESARGVKQGRNITLGNPKSPINLFSADYYPKNSNKPQPPLKLSHFDEALNKARRPSSAIAKKKQEKQRVQTLVKETDTKMKKKFSSPKLGEEREKMISSSNKERKGEETQHMSKSGYTPQLKNNLKLNRPNFAQPEPTVSGLRKKTANHRPLRVEEISRIAPKTRNTNKISEEEMNKVYGKRQEEKKERQARPQQKLAKSNIYQCRQKKETECEHEIRQPRMRKEEEKHQREYHQAEPREQIRQPQSRTENRSQRDPQPNRNRNTRNPQRRQNQPRQRPTTHHELPNPQHSTHSRNPSNFFTFVSQTINDQLELMNQFSMMSHVFENFNNFVNINIESHPTYFQFNSNNVESSDGYSDSSQSEYSDQSDYYMEEDSEEQGLNDYELQMIPIRQYRIAMHGSNQCTVCLIELKNGDSSKQLICEHFFHSDCIDEWLRRKRACPVCRNEVNVEGSD